MLSLMNQILNTLLREVSMNATIIKKIGYSFCLVILCVTLTSCYGKRNGPDGFNDILEGIDPGVDVNESLDNNREDIFGSDVSEIDDSFSGDPVEASGEFEEEAEDYSGTVFNCPSGVHYTSGPVSVNLSWEVSGSYDHVVISKNPGESSDLSSNSFEDNISESTVYRLTVYKNDSVVHESVPCSIEIRSPDSTCLVDPTFTNTTQELLPGNSYEPADVSIQWEGITQEGFPNGCEMMEKVFVKVGTEEPVVINFDEGVYSFSPPLGRSTVTFWVETSEGELVYERSSNLTVQAVSPALNSFQVNLTRDPDEGNSITNIHEIIISKDNERSSILVTDSKLYHTFSDAKQRRNALPSEVIHYNSESGSYDFGGAPEDISDQLNTAFSRYGRTLYVTRDLSRNHQVILFSVKPVYMPRYAMVMIGQSDTNFPPVYSHFCDSRSGCDLPHVEFLVTPDQVNIFKSDRATLTATIKNAGIAAFYTLDGCQGQEPSRGNFIMRGALGDHAKFTECVYNKNDIKITLAAFSLTNELVTREITHHIGDVPIALARTGAHNDVGNATLNWWVNYDINSDTPFPYKAVRIYSTQGSLNGPCAHVDENIPVDATHNFGRIDTVISVYCSRFAMQAQRHDGTWTAYQNLSLAPPLDFSVERINQPDAGRCDWRSPGSFFAGAREWFLERHFSTWKISGKNVRHMRVSCNRGNLKRHPGGENITDYNANSDFDLNVRFDWTGSLKEPYPHDAGDGFRFRCDIQVFDADGNQHFYQVNSSCAYH